MNLTNVNLVSDYNYKDSETKDGKRRNRWNKSQNTGKVVYSIVSITSYLYFLYRFLVFLSCFLVLFPLVLSCFFSFSGLVLILLTFIDIYVYLYLWIKYVLYCMYVCMYFIYLQFIQLFSCAFLVLPPFVAAVVSSAQGTRDPSRKQWASSGHCFAPSSRALFVEWRACLAHGTAQPQRRAMETESATRDLRGRHCWRRCRHCLCCLHVGGCGSLGRAFPASFAFSCALEEMECWLVDWRSGWSFGVVESSQIQAVQTTAWRGEALVFVSLVNRVRGAKRVD